MGNVWCKFCGRRVKKEERYEKLEKENDVYAEWLDSRRSSVVPYSVKLKSEKPREKKDH